MCHVEQRVEGTVDVGEQVDDVHDNSVELGLDAQPEDGAEQIEEPEGGPTNRVEHLTEKLGIKH